MYLSRLVYLLVLSALILSLVLAPPAHASGISVSPGSGDYNTEFTVTASGFIPGERVDTWVGKPSQWRIGQGQYTADDEGRVEFSFQADTTWGKGSFVAQAEGLSSGRFYETGFSIGGEGSPLGNCACLGVLLGSPGGLAVNYNAMGYGSSETVMVYMQDPSAQVHRLPNAVADPWGNLAFPLYFAPDSLYGPYLFTARGLTTGRTTYNTLTFWGGVRDHRSSNPISFATPTFNFAAAGFMPNERVSLRLVASNGSSKLLATLVTADGALNYAYIPPPGTPYGIYTLSAQGLTSNHIVQARFNWDGAVSPLP